MHPPLKLLLRKLPLELRGVSLMLTPRLLPLSEASSAEAPVESPAYKTVCAPQYYQCVEVSLVSG